MWNPGTDDIAVGATHYTGPATVRSLNPREGKLVVAVERFADLGDLEATIALADPTELRANDAVLVCGEPEALYMIGVLTRRSPEAVVRTPCGAQARVAADGATLQVFGPRQELLFEYDDEKRCARVVSQGDIEFAAGGRIDLQGANGIRVGGARVEVEADHDLQLASPRVALTGGRADVCVEETEISGDKLVARYRSVRLVANRLERVAKTVVERTNNLYQTVKGLGQTRAGRLRTLVEGTLHTRSRKAVHRTQEDFKVKAEKIHLG